MKSFPLADSIVDRDDARVAECGRRLRILHEVATAVCVRHPVTGQYLDGHFTIQTCVAGTIHLAHAPRAQQREHFIGAKARTRVQGHDAAALMRVPSGGSIGDSQLSSSQV
jgi:hypothetical protein